MAEADQKAPETGEHMGLTLAACMDGRTTEANHEDPEENQTERHQL